MQCLYRYLFLSIKDEFVECARLCSKIVVILNVLLCTMKHSTNVKVLIATFSNLKILFTLQNNLQSYNWILLAHVVIKTARIKGSRASLNAIAVAVSLRDSADVPFWLPGACDCCHKFETRFFSNKVNGTFFQKQNALQCLTLNTQTMNPSIFQANLIYITTYWRIDSFDRNEQLLILGCFSCLFWFLNKGTFWPD